MDENKIQVWNYESSEIRTVQVNGEPWFVLADVCKVLEIARGTKVAERLEEDEVRQTSITDSLGRQQKAYIINESGLYTVILRSDKPQAKPFRKWVTSEVLPSIRKHGAYMTEQTLERALTSPDFLIELATQLKAEQEQRKQLETTVAVQEQQIDSCNEKWEKIRQVRAEAGRKGGAKKGNQNAVKQKQTKQANACFAKQKQAKTSKNKQTLAKQAVTVTDTVTGTVTVTVTNKPPDGTAPNGAAPPAKPARK